MVRKDLMMIGNKGELVWEGEVPELVNTDNTRLAE